MLNALRMLGEDLREKARVFYQNDTPRAVAKVLATEGTLSMVLYRLMQGAHESRLGALEMIFNRMNSVLTGCIIGRGAEFGPGFVIIHAASVIINGKVRGGSKILVHQEVTIGDNDRGESGTLGSNISIGAGAKIIGPVHIGDGARIGANAVVVHDVDPDTTVVGVPARPVRRRNGAPRPLRNAS